MNTDYSKFPGPLHIDKQASRRLIVVRAMNSVPEDAALRIKIKSNPLAPREVDFDLFFDNYVDKSDMLYEDNGNTVILDKETAFQLIGSTLSVSRSGDFKLKDPDWSSKLIIEPNSIVWN